MSGPPQPMNPAGPPPSTPAPQLMNPAGPPPSTPAPQLMNPAGPPSTPAPQLMNPAGPPPSSPAPSPAVGTAAPLGISRVGAPFQVKLPAGLAHSTRPTTPATNTNPPHAVAGRGVPVVHPSGRPLPPAGAAPTPYGNAPAPGAPHPGVAQSLHPRPLPPAGVAPKPQGAVTSPPGGIAPPQDIPPPSCSPPLDKQQNVRALPQPPKQQNARAPPQPQPHPGQPQPQQQGARALPQPQPHPAQQHQQGGRPLPQPQPHIQAPPQDQVPPPQQLPPQQFPQQQFSPQQLPPQQLPLASSTLSAASVVKPDDENTASRLSVPNALIVNVQQERGSVVLSGPPSPIDRANAIPEESTKPLTLPMYSLFSEDNLPYSSVSLLPPSKSQHVPEMVCPELEDASILCSDMDDSLPPLDNLMHIDYPRPLFKTYTDSDVVEEPTPKPIAETLEPVKPIPEVAESAPAALTPLPQPVVRADPSVEAALASPAASGKKSKSRTGTSLRRSFKTLLFRKGETSNLANNPAMSPSAPNTPGAGMSSPPNQPASIGSPPGASVTPPNVTIAPSTSPSLMATQSPDIAVESRQKRVGSVAPTGSAPNVTEVQKGRADSFHTTQPGAQTAVSSSSSSPVSVLSPVSAGTPQPNTPRIEDSSLNVVEVMEPDIIASDLVLVYVTVSEDKVIGFSYPSECNTGELVSKFCADANLPEGKYMLGIASVNLYLFPEDDRPIRRMPFFQLGIHLGIPPVLELFARPAQPPVVVDVKILGDCVYTNFMLTQNTLGERYMNILSRFNSETICARRQFLLLQRQLNEDSVNVVAEKVRSVGLTTDQFLYLRAEQAFAYKDECIRIPNAENVELNVQVMPYNVPTFLSVRVKGDITVPDLMNIIFEEGRKTCKTQMTGSTTAHQKQFSIVDDIFTHNPLECVLKVMGWKEYVIPCNEYNQPVRLDSYEYVRKTYTSKEPLSLIVCPRSVLHQTPEYTEEQQKDQYAEQLVTTLLMRNVWREREHVTDFLLFSNLRFSMNLISATFLPTYSSEKDKENERAFYVSAALYHGGVELASPTLSPVVPCVRTTVNGAVLDPANGESDDPVDMMQVGSAAWNCKLEFGVSGKRIPREARVCLTIYSCDSSLVGKTLPAINEKHTPLGWFDFLLFDYMDLLRTGEFGVFLWPGKANPIGTCMSNGPSDPETGKRNPFLRFSVDAREKPVKYVPFVPTADALAAAAMEVPKASLTKEDVLVFKDAISVDMLTDLKPEQSRVLWEYRDLIRKSKPRCLPQLLRAVDWTITDMVYQVHKMLDEWKLLNPFSALELLDSKFADAHVRRFAVKCLEQMTDAECSQLLLQLLQVLKYEPYHVSPLANFLLHRALRSPNRIGQQFFWCLISEIHLPDVSERYGILLEMYLRLSPQEQREEILGQVKLLAQLEGIAREIKTIPKETRLNALRERLRTVQIPRPVSLPLDSRFCVTGLVVEKCRYMDSKKLPLWLVFQNSDTSCRPIYVLFKVGDDIRQDILTLQMMRMMDMLWKKQGKDLRMQLYRATATGDSVGMIEVVLDSETTANIAKERGGASAVLAETTVRDWLAEKNPTQEAMKEAIETFILSCAGYCVATYVLGIGDRHSDNVMVSNSGHFFHIDFGHFLGNVKYKLGVKRERTPFKFTPQFCCVFGGKGSLGYKEFVNVCCDAYNMLRHNGDLFITLFGLMLSTGIPELQSKEDIAYLQTALMRDLDDVAASEKFAMMIDETLHSSSQTINDMFHHWVHR